MKLDPESHQENSLLVNQANLGIMELSIVELLLEMIDHAVDASFLAVFLSARHGGSIACVGKGPKDGEFRSGER